MVGRTADGIAAADLDSEFDAAVAAAVHGDETAFTWLYRTMQPGLLRYLGVLVGVTDAEDVAAEAWSQACRDLPTFRGDGDGFRGWVTTIARHRALDHLRALRRRPMSQFQLDDLPETPAPDDAAAHALETLSTRAAMALVIALPPDQAEAVLLRTVIGLDGPAAARVLGKRAGAVRMATRRGLETLAGQLAARAAGAPSDTSSGSGAGGTR